MATVLSQRNPHPPLANRFPTYRHSGTFPPSCFHGLRAVAPLKLPRRPWSGGRELGFHGLRAVAPLKPDAKRDSGPWLFSFPRPPSRGSIEAVSPIWSLEGPIPCFHGLRAVAPLKPRGSARPG